MYQPKLVHGAGRTPIHLGNPGYLQFPISYRDLERMLADRGVLVDHTTMYRWVQHFAPELAKRMRRHLRPCRGPWHVDETLYLVAASGRS